MMATTARRIRVPAPWLLALALMAAAPAVAQEPFDDALESETIDVDDLDLDLLVDDSLSVEADALTALQLIEEGRYTRARELAEAMLRRDVGSFTGHFLLAAVLHRSEGSLAPALYHLKRARALFEARYGPAPGPSTPWRWHGHIIAEQVYVTGAMGRHQDKLDYLDQREALYEPQWPAERGWPLMRLRRYDQARTAALRGLASDDAQQQAIAATALCAIEAEQHQRERAWTACSQAAEVARERGPQGPTVFTNAAEAALGVLRLDDAERLILEGTGYRHPATVSNPWMDLLLLYLGQARTSEALDALRKTFAWRRRQPAVVDIQNQSEIDMAAVAFLLIAGRLDKAAEVTGRVLDRPDRTGYTSSEVEQMTAAAALLDSLANRLLAEAKDEEASWSPPRRALAARFEAARHRLRAWLSARRAASAAADARMLEATLRPYLAGSVEIPEWLEPELVEILGPGLVGAALRRARAAETLADAAGYFDLFEAEIALRQGRSAAAIDLVELAAQLLPPSEMLMRARLAAIGARAALDRGDRDRALAYLDRALQIDPGIVRRFGLALPTVIAAGDGALAHRTARLLRASPRFAPAAGGFRIEVDGAGAAGGAVAGSATLLDPRGAILARVRLTPRAGETTDDLARRLARELHEQAFAPRVDLTQQDLSSLDGSPTAGGHSAERIRSVLDDVVD